MRIINLVPELQDVFYRWVYKSMTFSNRRWISGVTVVTIEGAGAIGIEDAGKEKLAGTGEDEVTGVGTDVTIVVTGDIFTDTTE